MLETETKSKEKTILSKSKTPLSSKTTDNNMAITTSIDKNELIDDENQNKIENFKVEVEIEKKNIVQIDSNENNLNTQENELDLDNEALENIIVNTDNEIDLNINIGNLISFLFFI